MLNEIGNRARMVLKALKGDDQDKTKDAPESKAPVPNAPEDPDRMDPRVEDSSPTDEDLDKAKQDKAGDDPVGGGDDDQDGGDGEEEDPDKDGDKDGFDEFGHKDMDPRDIKKAFPSIGHLLPDEALDYIEDHEDAGNKEATGLEVISQAIAGFHDVLAKITAELSEMKKGQKAQGRDLKKALEINTDLKSQLLKIHETAPAANAPRAITKAMANPGAGADSRLTPQELTSVARSGKMSSLEIAILCNQR